MSTNLLSASRQWASRPVDERFWGLADMGDALRQVRDNSKSAEMPVRKVRAFPYADAGGDGADLCLKHSQAPVRLTHWSLGQLARYADAPPDYLRRLSPDTAAACLNEGLSRYDGDDVQLLLHNNGFVDGKPSLSLRSVTTPQYSRLWNSDIIEALAPALDRGWMVPPARPASDCDPRSRAATAADIVPGQDGFGLAVKPGDIIAPAGCYASDHDMFVFMVNPDRIIDVNGSGGLMRGFFLGNSEVGAGAFKIQTFLLEAVCGNHIVWGASDVRTYRKVHKGRNFEDMGDFRRHLTGHVAAYGDADTTAEMLMVNRARGYVLGRDKAETVKNLAGMPQLGLSQRVIEATYSVAEMHEDTAKAPPTTAWGFAHGLTRYSQATPYADQRAALDGAAGKLLALASN